MLSPDQIRFVSGLILAIPLSFIILFISNRKCRFFYSLIGGFMLQIFVYGWEVWMPILTHILVYLIIKIKGRKSGALVTWISIAGLSAYHIYRLVLYYGSWTLDISTIMMSMVCKYSLFAYAYEDGGTSEKDNKLQNGIK
eukprot:GHVR01170737.1.p1 GENE.GHVR01170737.1~~GHVR01170737.1.p1  ORF type:complete len:140 (+),score=2.60 GHVR01170737.1:1343-1762(+)